MADRTLRLWVAILISVMDVTVFERSFIDAWMTLFSIIWIRVALSFMLTVWTGSAAVIWLHVYYDFRPLLGEPHPATAFGCEKVEVRSDQGGPARV